MADVSERVYIGYEDSKAVTQRNPHHYGNAVLYITTRSGNHTTDEAIRDELQDLLPPSYVGTTYEPIVLDLMDSGVAEIPVDIEAASWLSALKEIYQAGVSTAATTLSSDERPNQRRTERCTISAEARRYIYQHAVESSQGVEPENTHELTPDGERVWEEISHYVDGSRCLPNVAYCSLADMAAIRGAITEIAGDEIEEGFIDGQLPERVRLRHTQIRIDKILSFWSAVPIKKRSTKRASGGMGSIRVKDSDPELASRVNQFANCLGVDPGLFFPERGASTKEAREVCKGCVVREECLALALQRGEKFGIWGGMSERQRRRIRQQQS